MSGRRCSRSLLGGRLATTLVDRYFHHYLLARAAALQSVAVRRSTGNDVVATISAVIYFFSNFILRRDLFS